MPSDPIAFALETPDHLRFPSNRVLASTFHAAGGSVERSHTGHLVFYRPDGRRFLATDPSGHPLHECEWEAGTDGSVSLTRARIRLDWDRWVGVKPGGLVNETTLNLATKPGWQRITADDLRGMAAQALRVPIEEVRWFYRDEDLSIDVNGIATIRQRKDALYALEDGGFDRATFMSCMGAMHWDRIDFLPVVELFKSLLPGTGSAAFELIRGLYDDQNRGPSPPRPLRYRGIPTYPSEAAFRLFSGFFTPQTPGGGDPLTLFMDPARAHQVTWHPASRPPVRYFDREQGLCLTVQDGVAQKATLTQDTAGLPYVNPTGRQIVPFDRSLRIDGDGIVLRDRTIETRLKLPAESPALAGPVVSQPIPVSPLDWRRVFTQGIPLMDPAEAYGAVLFYPDDHRPIGELAAQPFVADYLQDLGEQDRGIGAILSRAERVLIDNGDAVIATCVLFDRPRDYTAWVRHGAFAQRQAQQLWSQCAGLRRWDWLERTRFLPADTANGVTGPRFDLIYQWVPYASFGVPSQLTGAVARLRKILQPRGNAFIVGPYGLRDLLARWGFERCWEESVENLPTFRMHRTILPAAKLTAGLTLFHVRSL
jgi:hypothetical protein